MKNVPKYVSNRTPVQRRARRWWKRFVQRDERRYAKAQLRLSYR